MTDLPGRDHPQRALDAPHTIPAEWRPIPGTCSRCGRAAWLGEHRWWHQGPACRARRSNQPTAPIVAEFLPD